MLRGKCEFLFEIDGTEHVSGWDMRGDGCPLVLLSARRQETTASASALVFPADVNPKDSGWSTEPAAAAGFSDQGLDAVFALAQAQRSSEFIVVHAGHLVREARWAAGDATSDVASVQKSVVAVLIGMAIERKLIAIAAPVSSYLGEGWSQATPDQEAAITVRHLLTMTSGLNESLDYESPPGSAWRYNTVAYHYLKRILEVVAHKSHQDIAHDWLFAPLGMRNSNWVERRTGIFNRQPSTGEPLTGLATNGSDMARFGLFVLAAGKWREQTVLSDRGYLAAMLRPSNADNPAYGFLWWLNVGAAHKLPGSSGREDGHLLPTAPLDLVAALGAGDQRLYVVPSLQLVVVRRGLAAPSATFDNDLWQHLMAARTHSTFDATRDATRDATPTPLQLRKRADQPHAPGDKFPMDQ